MLMKDEWNVFIRSFDRPFRYPKVIAGSDLVVPTACRIMVYERWVGYNQDRLKFCSHEPGVIEIDVCGGSGKFCKFLVVNSK